MSFFWCIFYNVVFIPLLFVSYHVYALFNGKARDGLNGRKGLFGRLKNLESAGGREKLPVIWFHCASVGEFEQARPIITAVKDKFRIVVTFFSPSGYNLASKYPHADLVSYLPFDTPGNAQRMFQIIQPAMLIFVKFDVWPNYAWMAAKRGVPVILADATLHEKSKRLMPIICSFMKSIHKNITLHCAISVSDAERFKLLCPENARIEVMGDTRFDQVIARRNSAGKKLEGLLPEFNVPVIIAGSTYTEDEKVVIDAYQKVLADWGKTQLILVPHEPALERLKEIEKLMSQRNLPYIRLAELERTKYQGEVIIIDRVGVLAELYMLGDITFIGGSFHGSVHNVMEPAIMGKPVLFGPTIHNSLEAFMLIERGAGIMVKNGDEMASELIRLLKDSELRVRIGQLAKAMIEENAGATEKIVACINKFMEDTY